MLNEHSILKHAANSKHVDHVEWRQRFYLLLLYKNKAVCLGVSEFAAYFRQALSEVRGKTEVVRPDPSFKLPRPAVLLAKIGLCSEVFDFSPHFRNTWPYKECSSNISGICGTIQQQWKHQRAVAGKPDNDPSLSPPHVESTATVSLETSYRNAKQPSGATIGNAAFRPPAAI